MKRLKACGKIIAMVVLVTTVFSIDGFSAEVSVIPSIALYGGYNDNVLFNRTEEIEDYVGVVSPALELDYNTERGLLKGLALIDFIKYYEEDQLDTTNHRYELEGDYALTERWQVYAEGRYIFDTTLESELDETGRVSFREDRQRFDVLPGISYNISEISNLSLDYLYNKVDFESEESVDYTVQRTRLRYRHKLNNALDTIILRPAYTYNDSDTSERHSYRMDLGWSREVTELYRISIFLGYRHTEQDFKDDRNKQINNGGVVDIGVQRKGEKSDIRFSYNRNLALTASGGLVEVDRFRLRLYYRLVERFGVGFAGRLYFTSDVDEDVEEDSQYFNVEPWLQYNLTENHSLRLHYDYSEEYDDALASDKTASRNRVWLTLDFRFPQKW